MLRNIRFNIQLILASVILLTLLPTAWAEVTLSARRETSVYVAASADAKIATIIHVGELIVLAEPSGDFRKIKLKRAGKWRVGFVKASDANDLMPETAPRSWGFGGGLEFNHLSQGGRNFETDDEVQYTTSSYLSQTMAPFVSLQSSDYDFWRLSLATKTNHYVGAAVTNSGGGVQKEIRIEQKMLSAMLQRGFSPFPWRFIYAGGGLEVARSSSVAVTLDDKALTTSSEQRPTYFGVNGFAGAQCFVMDHLSLSFESRLGIVPNEKPMIYQYDFSAAVMYWL